jgi:hypothetical protein
MHAFGREVASRTIAGVLAGIILAAFAVGWKFIAPALAALLDIPAREAFAWFIAATSLIGLGIALWFLSRKPTPPPPVKPASLTLALDNGAKPLVKLTNHGAPTAYRVDGRIVQHVDGSQSSQPASFRCYLQVGGTQAGLDVLLKDQEWAHIILGDFEDVYPPSKGLTAIQSWTPIGKALVIRRGKMGQHVRVPDSGAIVELTFTATPPLAEPMRPRQFRIVRNGDVATITYV